MRMIAIALAATLSLHGITAQTPQKKNTQQQTAKQKPTPDQQAEFAKKVAAARAEASRQKLQLMAKMQAEVHAKLFKEQVNKIARRQQLYRALSQGIKPAVKPVVQQRLTRMQTASEELNRAKTPISLDKYLPVNDPVHSDAPRPSGPAGGLSINSLSVTAGEPGDPVWIHGSGFSASSKVSFVVAGGKKSAATIDYVDATDILTSVPHVTGIQAYGGQVIVSNGPNASAIKPFQFEPEMITAWFTMDANSVNWGDAGCAHNSAPGAVAYAGGPYSEAYWDSQELYCSVADGRGYQSLLAGVFVGGKFDDVYYSGVQLHNGWVLDSVDIASQYSEFTGSAGAQVQGAAIGSSSPSFKVHSYVDASQIEGYVVTVYVRGPVGTDYNVTKAR